MSALRRDIRYALRTMARSPVFTAVAVLTLAMGIGANTAIFTVINALLLRPLAFAEPHRLAVLSSDSAGRPSHGGPLSWLRFEQIRDHNHAFSAVAAYWDEVFSLTGRGDPEQVKAARVSWNFFDVLGVSPSAGRGFLPEEDRPGGDNVVVVSQALAARLGGASHVALDGRDYTIVGVLPHGFQFGMLGQNIDIFAPRIFELNVISPRQVQGGAMFLNAVARLRPGVTFRQAQEEMAILAAQYRESHAGFPDADPAMTIAARNLRDEMVYGVRTALLVLGGAVGLVLLIACANVAGLLLSRALGRQREIAVRTAIGATRGGLVRQLLTESVMLAVAGGALGAWLGTWATRVITSLAGANLPRAAEIHGDGTVLLFTLAISLFSGILFGLTPALQVSRTDLNTALRTEGPTATVGRGRNHLRSLLAVAQVALSMVLLIAAALLVRSFVEMRRARPGFEPSNLLTMNIALPPARYSRPRMAAFFNQLSKDVRELPGVRAVATSSALPANETRRSPALPEDQPPVPIAERPIFQIQTIGPEYVETMRLPLLVGREFTERDDAHAPPVVMVNETLARRYWPSGNAVGKHIVVGLIAAPMEVVGVIGAVRNQSLSADPQPEIDLPLAQLPVPSMTLLVRTASEPHTMVSSVRSRVLALDPELPVTAVQTMQEVFEGAAAEPRFLMSLLGTLSTVALFLALVGVYGVIAYSVTERTQEMGIRMALGAERGDILWLVLRQGAALAAAGIAIGVAASLAATRLIGTLLYRVSATDPVTFTAVPLLFGMVAVLASCVPAWRATRVDPLTALRHE